MGDEKGIGLELIFKIWHKHKYKTNTFFILGDYIKISKTLKKYKYSFKLKSIKTPFDAKKYFNKFLPVLNIRPKINECSE